MGYGGCGAVSRGELCLGKAVRVGFGRVWYFLVRYGEAVELWKVAVRTGGSGKFGRLWSGQERWGQVSGGGVRRVW